MIDIELEEYIKCSQDPVYFIRTYVKIVNIRGELAPFDLYPFQEELINTFHNNRYVVAKMDRLTGKTITTISYLLWAILFNKNYSVAILSYKDSIACKFLNILQRSYESLPQWLQQGATVWNKGNIELENGSRIIACSISSIKFKDLTINVTFIDNFTFVPDNIAEDFMTDVYPAMCTKKSKIFTTSSTEDSIDNNLFYKMLQDALDKESNYVLFT